MSDLISRQAVGVGDTFAVGKDFFKLESIESGTAVVRCSGTNDTFTYGVEMLRRTLRTVGYDLMKEVKWMNIVTFNRKWEINTKEDLEKAMEELDGNEFVANMSDEYSRTLAEVAEINKQRADVIRQAKEKGLWKE